MITVERGTFVDGISTTVLTRSHMTRLRHYLEMTSPTIGQMVSTMEKLSLLLGKMDMVLSLSCSP
jgi:hypothetical protein